MFMQVNEAIDRLENKIALCREKAFVVKSRIYCIFRKKDCTGQLSNTKSPRRPYKKGNYFRIIMLRKNPSQHLVKSKKRSYSRSIIVYQSL